jgi:hypothetical protein
MTFFFYKVVDDVSRTFCQETTLFNNNNNNNNNTYNKYTKKHVMNN